jgi:hypothetical protein
MSALFNAMELQAWQRATLAKSFPLSSNEQASGSLQMIQGDIMRSILLWLLGVPIPFVILIALLWH